MKSYYLMIFLFVFTACAQQQEDGSADENTTATVEDLKAEITAIDDRLKLMFDQAIASDDFSIDPAVYLEAIAVNERFVEQFPDDAFTEKAMGKIAALYFQLNREKEAVVWRNRILETYPNTKDKANLLELQMSYYGNDEAFDQAMIEYYADALLQLEDLSDEKRAEIEFRRAHSDKSFMELIEYQILNEGKEELE